MKNVWGRILNMKNFPKPYDVFLEDEANLYLPFLLLFNLDRFTFNNIN